MKCTKQQFFAALFIGALFGSFVASWMANPLPSTHAATVTTGVTFTTNQTVQYYHLNNAINNATISDIVSGDITDGTIGAIDLAPNSVTSAKVLDATLTGSDIGSRTITANNIVTNTLTEIELNTNLNFRSGTHWHTNVNTTINYAGPSTTLTYANNQVSSAAVSGTTNSAGAADSGKVVKLNPSGVLDTTITPFSKAYMSTGVVITAAGTVTLTHGLGDTPSLVFAKLINTSTEGGYSANDEVAVSFTTVLSGQNTGVAIVPTTTTLVLRYGNTANTFYILDKGTGASLAIDNTKWLLKVNAFK